MKKFFIVLAVIILLLVLGAYLLPRHVQVQRSAVIKASPAVLYAQIATPKNWPNWISWSRMDPNIKMTYFGPDAGTGSGYKWTSDKVGNGTLTITDAKPNESVETKMEFGKGGGGTSAFSIKTIDGGTEVIWTMESDMGYNPIARYFGLMMDKMVGKDFEKGLHLLDSVAVHVPMSTPDTASASTTSVTNDTMSHNKQ